MIRRLTASACIFLVSCPAFAGNGFVVCQQPFVYSAPINHGHVVQKQVFNNGYHQSYNRGHVVQKQTKVYHEKGNDVVGALQEIARQKQEYTAMIDGLQALGFSSQQTYQQGYAQQQQQSLPPVVPYAQAPYVQGTTAYSVKDVHVDAFGPQDVRELVAAVSRYSSEANTGANQLMSQANEITQEITASVRENTDAALRVATIDAEVRATEATANAMIEALRVTRPQQQTRISVQEREEASEQSSYDAGPPPPAPQSRPRKGDVSVGNLKAHCARCHATKKSDPPGGFRLSGWMAEEEAMAAASAVMDGTMPPEGEPLSSSQRLAIVAELQQLIRN